MRIGIDLGGTKISLVVLAEDGSERYRSRIATPHHDYPAIVRAVADLVHEAENCVGTRCTVGVGTPGALSADTGLIKNSNTTCLNGKPLQADLTQALSREVRLQNDANCMTLSEATDGEAQNAAVVFGVILGTGVGGGLVVRGQPWVGRNAIAGEWGHNPLPWPTDQERPGTPCYCGRSGCIETFLSGPGLASDYAPDVGRDAAVVVDRARAGDLRAQAALGRYENRLARALASLINVLDPDTIVLAGGVSQVDQLYTAVPGQWTQYVFSHTVDTRLVKATHGDDSGVRGAAWLWP